MPVFQINFSRPAGQIIASYYNFLRLGLDGYRRIHQASYDIGQYLAAEIVKLGPFELLCDSNPGTGIPTVTWRIREGEDPGYTLFDLADRLRNRGWQVPAYTLTGTASDIAGAAHPGPPRRQPGHGRAAARRLPRRGRPLPQAPGHRVHDQGGIGRVQPPVKPGDNPRRVTLRRRWLGALASGLPALVAVLHLSGASLLSTACARFPMLLHSNLSFVQ